MFIEQAKKKKSDEKAKILDFWQKEQEMTENLKAMRVK